MYRKVVGIVLTTAAMNVGYVSALGLGEMTMHSALHQPLDAEIKLTNVGDLDEDQIKIRLADSKAFELASVERTHFLGGMKFKVRIDDEGNAVVRIFTAKSVKEPFLDFLIEARWPSGKVIRSYTTLVDLPVYQSGTKQVVTTYSKPRAHVKTSKDSGRSNNDDATVNSFAYKTPKIATESSQSSSYRVKNNDTLWEIARKVKPARGVTIQQTMLAIQKMNPSAFPNNNINRLRAGSVLRIPSVSDVDMITSSKAIALVSEQNKQWMGSQLDATHATVTYAKPEDDVEGHLSLSSSGSGQSGGLEEESQNEKSAAISQENKELLEVSKLENQELTTKVESLSGQINQLERLIELKDAELAALQQRLADQNSQLNEAPIASSAEVNPVEEADPVEKKILLSDEKSKLAFLSNIEPIYFGGVALFILAMVVAFLLQRREKSERKAVEDANNFDFDDLDKPFVAPVVDTNLFEEDSDSVEPEQDATVSVEAAENVETLASVPTQVETDDAISEADIYIAYGRFEQAVELLQGAIATSGDNLSLRNKLLDVYLESKDREGFRQQLSEAQHLNYESVTSHAKEILSSSDHQDWIDQEEDTVNVEEDILAPEFAELSKDDNNEALVAEDEDTDITLGSDAEAGSEIQDATESLAFLSTESPASSENALDLPELDIDLTDMDELSIDSGLETALLDVSDEDFLSLDNSDETEALNIDVEGLPTEEAIEIDLADFGLDFDGDGSTQSQNSSDDTDLEKTNEPSLLADQDMVELSDDAITELDIDFEDSNESLDESIEALVKLSEATLAENAESAFLDPDEEEISSGALTDSDLTFISSTDEVATKLDLARAYIDMGDLDGAKDMLQEVIKEGGDQQKIEAAQLMDSCS